MAGLRVPQLKFRAFTAQNGLSGGKLYTYAAGTSTPLLTYSDAALTVPNSNPITLDSRGEANVFLTPGKAYKIVTKDSSGVLIDTQDYVYGASPAGGSAWLNLLSYGADPTGVADSTAAIQSWLTDAATQNYTAYAPAGTYKMNSGVNIPGKVSILGDGFNRSKFNYTPVNGAAFTWTADGTYSIIQGIQLYNNNNSRVVGQTSVGFKTWTGAACVGYLWDSCTVEGFSLWGIDLNDSFQCAIRDSRIRQNGVRASLAGLGVDGQGGGVRLIRITFTGSASTGNDYTNTYFTGNNYGIQIEPSGSNQKVFNTRLDNCFFEENYCGADLRNRGTGGKGRYIFLNTCYFEANIFAGAQLDEGTTIACYQNSTTAGTGVPPSVSTDGADGITFEGRFVEDRPSRFRVGNNSAAPYDETDNIAFSVDKGETTNYVTTLKVNSTAGLVLTKGAGSADVDDVKVVTGAGTPEATVTANSASLYLNRSGTAINNILYVKTSDASNTGWVSIGAQYGTTVGRPTADATNKGVRYYDTDILRSVVSNGAGLWREYNGLTLVTGTLANAPSHIQGAAYYATDRNAKLVSDGARWRTAYVSTEFASCANGGTTTIGARGGYVVNTGAAIGSHTVTLPSGTSAVSGDKVIFVTNGAITTLTVNAGAATVLNAPTTLSAGTSFEFVYNDGTTTWYRVR